MSVSRHAEKSTVTSPAPEDAHLPLCADPLRICSAAQFAREDARAVDDATETVRHRQQQEPDSRDQDDWSDGCLQERDEVFHVSDWQWAIGDRRWAIP